MRSLAFEMGGRCPALLSHSPGVVGMHAVQSGECCSSHHSAEQNTSSLHRTDGEEPPLLVSLDSMEVQAK